jgi:hypothetical protein
VNKRHFFGSLFVRAAKRLALLVLLAGIGFAALQYIQARIAAGSAAYQPSPPLQQALGKLKDALSSTEHIVSSFNAANQSTTPTVQPFRFPSIIRSNEDFAQVDAELARVEQERQQLKQSVVSRFEGSVANIEEKLRSYAAQLHSAQSPTVVTHPGPALTPVPSPSPTLARESLFSSKLGPNDANERIATLTQRKEFLEGLGAKAQNADNRAKVAEATDQLDALGKLLPEKLESSVAARGAGSRKAPAEPGRKLLLSERVAGELQQLRGDVRQMLLTPWALDDTLEQAIELNSIEREKCRVATLAQKGIWLSATSRILIELLAAVFAALLILVCADLVKSLLNMAVDTDVVADAIRAIRGMPTSASQRESGQS